MQLDRHRIVRLDPAAWPALIAAQPDFAAIPAVVEWTICGRPLIARRPACSHADGAVPLGLPLPPSLGKRRLAVAAPANAVRSADLPPLLADASEAAPATWWPTLVALVGLDRDVRCYGSLAWQHLTGFAYVSETSDVDLLWQVASADAADRLVVALAGIEAEAPMKLDGELLAPSGVAAPWREWAAGAPEVLVKDREGARLVRREMVFA